MWTIIIGLILGLIIGIIAAVKTNDDENIGPCLVIFGIIGIITSFALNCKTCQVEKDYPILCLKDVSSVKGNFFLGCGCLDGTMVYTFYYKDGEDIIGKKIDWDRVKIRESNNKPYLKVISTVKTNDLINKFAIDFVSYHDHYYIYVPKGTIKQDFVLDAE